MSAVYRAGDILYDVRTAESLRVSRVRGGHPRYWEPVGFRAAVRDWMRGDGWRRTRVLERWPLFID